MIRALALALALCTACKGGSTEERPASVQRDERARIEALLSAVERSNVVFLRNGREHSAQEAADHLRRKWRGADVTAEQFIDRYGTESSSSGRPYRVRIGDSERDAGPWLHELLVAL
ncbi:MAG: DUF5329 family protein [Kofleriaceae bacterium]